MKTAFVIELDDKKDIDFLKSILDPYVPQNVAILNCQFDLLSYNQNVYDPDNIYFICKASRHYFDLGDDSSVN